MKLTTRLLSLLALALIAGTANQARAEEQEGYPVQVQIESRQIHATHSLHCAGCEMPMQHKEVVKADEAIAPAILFPTGSDKLTPAAMASVKKVAAMLKTPAFKGRHVLISGYTDNKGKAANNQRLSFHRATQVVKALVKLGVPSSQLTAQGFGEENPVADNATEQGRMQNRRVTFTAPAGAQAPATAPMKKK